MKEKTKMSPNNTKTLLGERGPRYRSGADIISEATSSVEVLNTRVPRTFQSMTEMKESYAPHCRAYYALAALSRRRTLGDKIRQEAMAMLFRHRVLIERSIYNDFALSNDRIDIISLASSEAFFGRSAKQGVSIRYPLASCIPTEKCGSRCYAHDGRDREINHIFRGVLNWYLGNSYEKGSNNVRQLIMRRLKPAISSAVGAARMEMMRASLEGYKREPRIRFSHIGEMVDTPAFTNALASEIKNIDATMKCVLYTRHPNAARIDPDLFLINFTVEEAGEKRRLWAPANAALVGSAWDGRVIHEAMVNFLEHHVEKVSATNTEAMICPVTLFHKTVISCDDARCDRCFRCSISE